MPELLATEAKTCHDKNKSQILGMTQTRINTRNSHSVSPLRHKKIFQPLEIKVKPRTIQVNQQYEKGQNVDSSSTQTTSRRDGLHRGEANLRRGPDSAATQRIDRWRVEIRTFQKTTPQ